MNRYTQKILIIDDESSIRTILRLNLEPQGFTVIEAATGKEGIEKIRTNSPDVVVLDLGLPDQSGITVLKEIRSLTDIPVIVLSVQDLETLKVNLLDSGANDYVTKPFSVPELLARIKVSLRMSSGSYKVVSTFNSGDLSVDFDNHKVFVGSKEVHLSVKEFGVLQILIEHAGRVVSQDVILKTVWGPHSTKNTHYLRIYVGQLRKKIEKDPSNPKHLITEPGLGYRMV